MTTRTRLTGIIGLAALLVSACAGSQQAAQAPGPSPEQTAPSPAAVNRLVADLVADTVSVTPAEVRRRLGTPHRTETESVENRHVPLQMDTLRTLVYDGLEMRFYDVSQSDKVFLQHLTVTSAPYEAPQGLRVGLSLERVEQLLGTPMRREDNRLFYELGRGDVTPTMLTVHVRSGAVLKIEWSFYVD